MKLYTYDRAPNPRRLELFLQIKGIYIDSEQIDMMNAGQLTDEFRQINPACTLPALVLDDGTVLAEVIGICTYLEALHPEKPMLGTTPLEKAQVASWDHKVFVGLMMAIASVLRNGGKGFVDRALPGPLNLAQIPELAERGRLQIRHILPELDTHLAQAHWLTGDNFTFADIDLLVTIEFLAWVKEGIPEDCTHLQAWYQRAAAELA
jgi:glutathione S-transferase